MKEHVKVLRFDGWTVTVNSPKQASQIFRQPVASRSPLRQVRYRMFLSVKTKNLLNYIQLPSDNRLDIVSVVFDKYLLLKVSKIEASER